MTPLKPYELQIKQINIKVWINENIKYLPKKGDLKLIYSYIWYSKNKINKEDREQDLKIFINDAIKKIGK